MSRTSLLVLLLATGIVLADEAPETEPAPTASQEKAQEAPKPEKQANEAQLQDEQAKDPQEGENQPTNEEAKEQQSGESQAKDGEAKNEQAPQEAAERGKNLGMSILGNQEAPKSLVIVPWKSSILGDSVGISTILDDSKQPIDKEVFMRALSYYEIRSGQK